MIRKIIELKLANTSSRTISDLLGIARGTTDKYVQLLNKTGLSYPDLLKLSDADLEELFVPKATDYGEQEKGLDSFLPYAARELGKVGVTHYSLWTEYKVKYPAGYQYSQFNLYLRKWIKGQDVPMHFEHKAGDKLFVDYTGKKLEYVDADTGEVLTAEIFVAILGCSQLTYVEASASQKKEDFIAQATAVHGDKFCYSLLEDEFKYGTKVPILCEKHGEFTQTAGNHITNKRGCPQCGFEHVAAIKKQRSKEKFFRESPIIHDNKYDYSKVDFVKVNTKPIFLIGLHLIHITSIFHQRIS